MAKKKNKNKNNDGGEKKEDGSIASKIVKWVKSFQGAESVKSEKQLEKTDNDEKPKEAPLRTVFSELDFPKPTRRVVWTDGGGNDGNDGNGINGGKIILRGTAYRHENGYQNVGFQNFGNKRGRRSFRPHCVVFGILVFGLLVMYKFHLAKDICTYVTLLTHRLLYI